MDREMDDEELESFREAYDDMVELMLSSWPRFEHGFCVNAKDPKEHYDPVAVVKMACSCLEEEGGELSSDIVQLTSMFISRGPNISAITEYNTSKTGYKIIDTLKKKYKLKDFASAEEVAEGKALSLKQLMAAFPYLMLNGLKERKRKPLGENVLRDAKASKFPGFLKNSIFLSVIPFPSKNSNTIWSNGEEGIKKFITIIQGVIAYEFLEFFILYEWGNNSVPLTQNKALSNVISGCQNFINSDYFPQDLRKENFVESFKKEIIDTFKDIENLIFYTESKYPGFKNTLSTHFSYDVSKMKFECKEKNCQHLEL